MQRRLAFIFSFFIFNACHAASFIGISDIHLNPFFSCAKQKKQHCKVAALLMHFPVKQWPHFLLKADHGRLPYYGQDSNYTLVKLTLKKASQIAKQKHANFVLVTGDMMAHKLQKQFANAYPYTNQKQYQTLVLNLYKLLRNEFQHYFPNIPVYFSFGNHDSLAGNYKVIPNGLMLKSIATTWAPLLRNKQNESVFKASFPKGGYYVATLPNATPLKLVSLNSVLFTNRQPTKAMTTAAKTQFVWLNGVLNDIQSHHQAAWLAMHIPPAINSQHKLNDHNWNQQKNTHLFWGPNDIINMMKLLNRFQQQIHAIFTGHLHIDGQQEFSLPNGMIMNSFIPAVSPIIHTDPSFKVFHYQEKTARLESAKTYRIKLKKGPFTPAWIQDTWRLNP